MLSRTCSVLPGPDCDSATAPRVPRATVVHARDACRLEFQEQLGQAMLRCLRLCTNARIRHNYNARAADAAIIATHSSCAEEETEPNAAKIVHVWRAVECLVGTGRLVEYATTGTRSYGMTRTAQARVETAACQTKRGRIRSSQGYIAFGLNGWPGVGRAVCPRFPLAGSLYSVTCSRVQNLLPLVSL